MEEHDIYLFIRNRGRVAGPFDFDKLVSLARKGQLSRMHEVSTDQMSWARAGKSYPQIWEGWTALAPTPEPVEVQPIIPEELGADVSGTASMPMSEEDSVEWHFTKNGTEQPVTTLGELKHLFSLGELTGEEEVWTEGMSEWRKASDVPALAAVVANKRPLPAAGSGSGGTPVQAPMGQQPNIIIQAPAAAPPPEVAAGSNGGLIAWGYVCAFLFPFVGGILGIVALAKGEVGNGIGIILLSLFSCFFWVGFWPAFQAAL